MVVYIACRRLGTAHESTPQRACRSSYSHSHGIPTGLFPFPNTHSQTITCKCKQSTANSKQNSSTENWKSVVKNKYSKNTIHNTLKIRQNIFTVFLERLKVFVSRYGPRIYRPEYHAVLYSPCPRPNARLQ